MSSKRLKVQKIHISSTTKKGSLESLALILPSGVGLIVEGRKITGVAAMCKDGLLVLPPLQKVDFDA